MPRNAGSIATVHGGTLQRPPVALDFRAREKVAPPA